MRGGTFSSPGIGTGVQAKDRRDERYNVSMDYWMNADDYGLTRGITDGILDVCDSVDFLGVSLVANGYAFDYALEEYQRRDNVRLAVHLNICEGRPVTPPDEVHLLVDSNGRFCHSFPSLWMKHALSSRTGARILKEQVKREFAMQIAKVSERLGPECVVNVNSHQHYHMIPFCFEGLLELSGPCRISHIRTTYEPLLLSGPNLLSLGPTLMANSAKHTLLNRLSRRYRRLLSHHGVRSNDYFFGTLYTGCLTEPLVTKALDLFSDRTKIGETVEFLFHPGTPTEEERMYWRGNQRLMAYYFSPWRNREMLAIKKCSGGRREGETA
jgi:predicted glycoside hydrolase/deacetylase ChbG (UPF0249 family)